VRPSENIHPQPSPDAKLLSEIVSISEKTVQKLNGTSDIAGTWLFESALKRIAEAFLPNFP
jgi:hypothetical protein